MALERDGDGYLMSMADWSEDVMHEMAKADDYELTPEKIEQIMKAREYYDENSTVPAIRVFAKFIGMDKKDMFKMWLTGPMKPITKYGGLPKPTGCV
ncbi:MAG: TusE/DsrC/DsvC family sulfur relay protein [Gammaproteobacteria bacterium]|jgi:TusE/DsrC/DsvC family sulfur relay protein|nr:TusE/DsrC/DsvC family sulfur relay protein [Gammaproteobacteria bacterium]